MSLKSWAHVRVIDMAENIYSFSARYKSAENIASEPREVMQMGFTRGQTPEHARERVIRGIASHGHTDIQVSVNELAYLNFDFGLLY